LLDLIDRIYDAQDEIKRWSSVLEGLEAGCGESLALFMPFPTAGAPGYVVAPSIDPEFLASYQRHYFHLDPVVAAVAELPPGTVEIVCGAGSRAILASSAFEREWLAPQGFLSAPTCVAVVDRDTANGTSLLRAFPRTLPHPSARLRAKRWRDLMPHMRRACRVFREMHRLGRRQQLLEQAIDRLAVAILVVDASGRVILKNAAADRILAQRDGLYLEIDGIHAYCSDATQLLRHAAEEDPSEGDRRPDAPRVISLPRLSGRRALLVVAVGEGTNRAQCTLPDRSTTLYVTDPEQALEMSSEALRDLFRLTPAEAALARAILDGHSVETAAVRLNIRTETARGRLKTIFLKTRTHRQTDLVRLLLAGQAQLLPGAIRDDQAI
jgi:DNA-binding CsgD family transcriptional regulator/PAS domain-containing protein